MKNFELTNETVVNEAGVTLHRIRAVKDIVTPHFTVKAGDLGGFVEKEENLDDNAWVPKENIIRTENWCGHDIRFIEQDGEWYAILKDICDALDLKTFKVSQRLDPDMMIKVKVDGIDIPSKYNDSKGAKSFWVLAVNEIGIYEALFASRRLEARKFRMWTATVLQKLRKNVGLEGYEIMKMTDPDIQDEIDRILDTIFYDEEKGMLMQSVTVQGGDVEQIPFE